MTAGQTAPLSESLPVTAHNVPARSSIETDSMLKLHLPHQCRHWQHTFQPAPSRPPESTTIPMNQHSTAPNPVQPRKGLPAQISNTTQQKCLHASAASFPTNRCSTRLPPSAFFQPTGQHKLPHPHQALLLSTATKHQPGCEPATPLEHFWSAASLQLPTLLQVKHSRECSESCGDLKVQYNHKGTCCCPARSLPNP
jgi:hypothetical protein